MNHWPRLARAWELLGPPLRPSAFDVDAAAHEVGEWSRLHGRAPRVLLLGVTPELAVLPCAQLVAVDRSADMIGALFPRGDRRAAVVADWRALPIASRSIDIVLGDGALTVVPFPAGARALAGELDRVVADDGALVLRMFLAPEPAARESLAEVAAELAAGTIGSMNALKWRIAMARPDAQRVPAVDILRDFARLVPDLEARDALPWSRAHTSTIDSYRDSSIVYAFPTRAETAAVLAPWQIVSARVGSYELADRCPTLILRRPHASAA